jgi:hypothetical protein
VSSGNALQAGNIGFEITNVDSPGDLDERKKNVQSGASHAVKSTKALDDHHLGLADDLQCLADYKQSQQRQDAKNDVSRHTFPQGVEAE